MIPTIVTASPLENQFGESKITDYLEMGQILLMKHYNARWNNN